MLSRLFIPDRVPNPVRGRGMSGKMPTANHYCRTCRVADVVCSYFFLFIILVLNLLPMLNALDNP